MMFWDSEGADLVEIGGAISLIASKSSLVMSSGSSGASSVLGGFYTSICE
jgi:hypothetical protein